MTVSAENKAVAKFASRAFGGSLRVQKYHHDCEDLSVDILRCEDRPDAGVTSYSTVTLSDHPMYRRGREFPTRLELAGVCATSESSFANVLASAAFCIIRTDRLYSPGSVLQGYVREYYPASTVPHLYLSAPFLWGDALGSLELETRTVAWLLVVPISDAEHRYLKKQGDAELEKLFEEHQIDLFNLNRSSVL